MHIALWEPEIPPNTGNIARLCAATGTTLHLIGRLGFRTDDRTLARAGLDYWQFVSIHKYASFDEFELRFASSDIICIENPAEATYTSAPFTDDCCLLFGNETGGLPATICERYKDRIFSIPMPGEGVRSLNLATAVGIVLYEGLRQLNRW